MKFDTGTATSNQSGQNSTSVQGVIGAPLGAQTDDTAVDAGTGELSLSELLGSAMSGELETPEQTGPATQEIQKPRHAMMFDVNADAPTPVSSIVSDTNISVPEATIPDPLPEASLEKSSEIPSVEVDPEPPKAQPKEFIAPEIPPDTYREFIPTTPTAPETPQKEHLENTPPQPEKHHEIKPYRSSNELDKELDSLHDTETEMLARRAADMWHMPYVNLVGMPIDMDALSLIPQREAFTSRVVGFKSSGNNVSVAIDTPSNVDAQATIKSLERRDYTVTPYLASKKSIDHCLERYSDLKSTIQAHGGMVDIHSDALTHISETIKTGSDAAILISELIAQSGEQGTTSRIIEAVLGCAIALGGSDVHIEPQENFVRLRLRVDGILADIIQFPSDVAHQIASRIKILSGMKLTVTKDAQDGRFTITYGQTQIEVRVSSIPGPYGEGIVMRILDPRGLTVSFEKLGIEPRLLEIFKAEIEKPEGIILTSGPTGSGKTTTLYSFLQSIYDPEIKVITIEDPIEYHLAGIQQTQVDHTKGYDFLSGLRAAMRQDPEVVMVGEIRDTETATTAVQAAQTGHLVLSTIHTNSAAGIIPRLLVLGVNPSMLASVLRLAISQRLVRKLVPETAKKRTPNETEEHIIRRIINNAIKNGKDLTRFGITPDMSIELSEPGASDQYPTGYHGRIGIFEAITMNDDLEKLLEGSPSEREVRMVANRQGLLSITEDAIVKVLSGMTSLSEIQSVIDLEDGLPDEHLESESKTHRVDPHDHIFKTPAPQKSRDVSSKKELSDEQAELGIDPLLTYLDELEHKGSHKSGETSAKIEALQDVILDLVKKSHGIGVDSDDIGVEIEHTIATILGELEDLRQKEIENPDPEILKKLKEIEESLQNITNITE